MSTEDEGILYVVTDPADIGGASEAGIPFVYYIDLAKACEGNSYCEGVKYVLEGEGEFDPDEFDEEYFESIYRRLNKQALSRIFANLLNNAVKYSDGDLKIKLLPTGEMVFENTAKALSSVKTEQLFDRFFTVKTSVI